MFCSSCGNTVNPGLRFCNSCGARISRKKERSPGQFPESSVNLLISAIVGIPLGGIGIMIGLLVVMKQELGLRDEMIMLIATMGFAMLLVAEIGLIVLLLHKMRLEKKEADGYDEIPPAQLPDVVIRGLNEARQRSAADTISSVTEHTTRTLDPIRRETGDM